MKLFSFLTRSSSSKTAHIGEIYSLALNEQLFVNSDIVATYTKILTDTLERTHGIPDEVVPVLWDNCVQSETQYGLVSLLVKAMTAKSDLFLVYKSSVNVLREATPEEQQKIRADYKSQGQSPLGVFISFRNYHRTDMLRIYSAFEFCILGSLNKTMNLSRAIQIKIDSLRSSVSLADEGLGRDQAIEIADSLKAGSDVFMDAKDSVVTATADIGPTEKAIGFLNGKRAYYLDLPLSYVSGQQTTGIGSTGEADTLAVERGLKQYFFSIVHPVLKAIFDIDTEFKSKDFRHMNSALEALKTFDLVSPDILSTESKQEIIARLFDLDIRAERRARARETVRPNPVPEIEATVEQ